MQKPSKPHSSSAWLPIAWGESRTQSKEKTLNNPSLANKRPPKQRQLPKALPAHNKIVLGILENNAIRENWVKHLCSKTMLCSSEHVLSIENKFFYLTWLFPKIIWAIQIMSGYTVISSSLAKFLCLQIQKQKKYFVPFPPFSLLVRLQFFLKSALSYYTAPNEGRQHLLIMWQATAFSYFRSRLKS